MHIDIATALAAAFHQRKHDHAQVVAQLRALHHACEAAQLAGDDEAVTMLDAQWRALAAHRRTTGLAGLALAVAWARAVWPKPRCLRAGDARRRRGASWA